MSKTYSYNNDVYSEEQVLKAAQNKNLSIEEYVKQYGINVAEDEYSLSKAVDDPETKDVDESVSYRDFLAEQERLHDERQLVDYDTWLNEFAPRDIRFNALLEHPLNPSIQDAFSIFGNLIETAIDMTPFGDDETPRTLDKDDRARKRKLKDDRIKGYEAFKNEYNPENKPSNITPDVVYMAGDVNNLGRDDFNAKGYKVEEVKSNTNII